MVWCKKFYKIPSAHLSSAKNEHRSGHHTRKCTQHADNGPPGVIIERASGLLGIVKRHPTERVEGHSGDEADDRVCEEYNGEGKGNRAPLYG